MWRDEVSSSQIFRDQIISDIKYMSDLHLISQRNEAEEQSWRLLFVHK